MSWTSASVKIADEVIAEASRDSGLVRAYFLRSIDDGNWEGKQRQAFPRLRNALRANVETARKEAVELLWQLRNNYRVQYFPTASRSARL